MVGYFKNGGPVWQPTNTLNVCVYFYIYMRSVLRVRKPNDFYFTATIHLAMHLGAVGKVFNNAKVLNGPLKNSSLNSAAAGHDVEIRNKSIILAGGGGE